MKLGTPAANTTLWEPLVAMEPGKGKVEVGNEELIIPGRSSISSTASLIYSSWPVCAFPLFFLLPLPSHWKPRSLASGPSVS